MRPLYEQGEKRGRNRNKREEREKGPRLETSEWVAQYHREKYTLIIGLGYQ
jgi:hypothetical protein